MAAGGTLTASPFVDLGHAVRAELDINTAPSENAALDQEGAAANARRADRPGNSKSRRRVTFREP